MRVRSGQGAFFHLFMAAGSAWCRRAPDGNAREKPVEQQTEGHGEGAMDLTTRQLEGLADICELMAATFAYPSDGSLAEALVDGSYASDLQGCLSDIAGDDHPDVCGEPCGAPTCDSGEVAAPASGDLDGTLARELGELATRNPGELADLLKKGHSVLFLAPGANVPVWPYEAAFRFVQQGRPGTPSLFRSPIELDVERHMRAAGVLPQHARTEPPDSVWNEFSFMAYLLAQAVAASRTNRADDLHVWFGRAQSFLREHLSAWVPAFMEKTAREAGHHSFGAEYTLLAHVGTTAWCALSSALDMR